jgi:hypothetical protein
MNPILDDTDLALKEAQAITDPPITADAITAKAGESAAPVTTDEAPTSAPAITADEFRREEQRIDAEIADLVDRMAPPPIIAATFTTVETPKSAPRLTDPSVASAIASTLPTPPPSDPVLPDGAWDGVMDEVAETLDVVKRIDSEVSNVTVSSVPEAQTAVVPDTPVQAAKRQSERNMFAAVLKAKGIDQATIDELVVQREITVGRQRKHPVWATVCSPQMVAYFAIRITADGTVVTRTDRDLEADALKQMRNDGGKLGPALCYQQLIETAANVAAAAAAINDHVTRRIKHLRMYLCAVINELRRRRAAAAGLDPKTIDYLAVR